MVYLILTAGAASGVYDSDELDELLASERRARIERELREQWARSTASTASVFHGAGP